MAEEWKRRTGSHGSNVSSFNVSSRKVEKRREKTEGRKEGREEVRGVDETRVPLEKTVED